ncbi:tetratricopeptide repeat protein [Stieleria varia]|uniref:Tetratricopeptide repeat protein n=1 Tax=Stieleria varia TaxID=2528005 RepID=A0A5C6B7L4_9BACT|nr:tetratricopeptide repeat protein [Stieleria varia]TWU08063.1 Tetratricopeptide repeat protein [Stieleria varia]
MRDLSQRIVSAIALAILCWVASGCGSPVENSGPQTPTGADQSSQATSAANASKSAAREPDATDSAERSDGDSSEPLNASPWSTTLAPQGEFPEGYVGTATCAQCHPNRHASFLETHHSRSLSLVDAMKDRSRDIKLQHPASGREYDTVEQEGTLWHREWKRFGDGPRDRVLVNELPVGYAMGSGAFAQGYLLTDEDYLLQSPVTWYRGSDHFGMAPGYDQPNHFAMTRLIDADCLFCHAGLVSRRDNNPHKPIIHELAIGCERCHGPGEEHTRLYRDVATNKTEPTEVVDSKIVNPNELDRMQVESMCGQCHLQGDVVVHAAGKDIWDFVAGEDLAQTRVHYKNEPPGDFSKVFTGHFDQMWQSPCYVQSETLTCVTCHDSHRSEPIADQVSYRRDQCNQCHADQGCAMPIADRETQCGNDCVSCHMPSIASEVPHTSTTSHLIAIYRDGVPQNVDITPRQLRRLQQTTSLSEQQLARRDRLAEAYNAVDQAQLGNLGPLAQYQESDQLLELLRNDRSDAEIYSLLARMAWIKAENLPPVDANRAEVIRQRQRVLRFAPQTLQLEPRPLRSREAALEALSMLLMDNGNFADAVQSLEELTRIRRTASDQYNLGLCLARVGRIPDAERAFRAAIEIDGSYTPPYHSLSVLYRTVNPTLSQQFAQREKQLRAAAGGK